jgi:integrase
MKQRQGYVFLNNGKWYARVTITDSSGTRRNIKRTAKDKHSAKELLKQIVSELATEGERIIDGWQMTFADLADYYETHYAIPAKFVGSQKVDGLRGLATIKYCVLIYRNYFGTRKLRDITHGDLKAFRSNRLNTITRKNTERTVTTVNRELAYLRRMFSIAVQQGWIVKNPFNAGDALILTSCEKRRERILTLAEETLLLAACDDPKRSHLKPLLIALLDTGARKGEMLKLKWSDVDLVNRIVTIRAQNTKTLSERQVAITQRLWKSLTSLWKASNGEMDAMVFGISSNVKRSFSTACGIAGIKHGGLDGLTLHCLRHTAATRLVNGQLPIQMVGRILGHTQVNTTYRYITANTDTARQAASILESYQNDN